MSAIAVRTMRREDLALTLDWAAAEGWNPGLQDARCFTTVDPAGLLLGTVDDQPVGAITVVNYDPHFAFLGCYLVRPELRGRGHGLALWHAGMAHAGARLVGLDGVVAQQANYARSGFVLAHRNIRFGGLLEPRPTSAELLPLTATDLDAIATLDAKVFPAARTPFLEAWLTAPGHVALGLRRDGGLVGFAVRRPCRTGAKIGPVVAPDRAGAEALIDGLVARAGRGEHFLDVPERNRAAVTLAEERGLRPVFETARMYTGPAPALALGHVFGITTFELG